MRGSGQSGMEREGDDPESRVIFYCHEIFLSFPNLVKAESRESLNYAGFKKFFNFFYYLS